MKSSILVFFLFLLSFSPTFVFADEKPVIKLQIDETMDEKKSENHYAQFVILQFFYLHGFDVISVNPTVYDEKMEVKGFKDFSAWQSAIKNKKPLLTVKGKAVAKLNNLSEFYGSTVAFIYRSTIELTITDSSGKVLGTIKDDLKYGAANRGVNPKARAARDCLKNLALFTCPSLYNIKEIQSNIAPDLKPKLEKRLQEIEKYRNKLKEDEKKMKKDEPKKDEPKKDEPKKDNGGPF